MTKQPSNVSEERIIINCRDAWPEDPEACACSGQNTLLHGQDGAIGSEEDFTSDKRNVACPHIDLHG
jgi:hypothetical protein